MNLFASTKTMKNKDKNDEKCALFRNYWSSINTL